MKPSYSWTFVCRPLLPFALGALAACSGSEPTPSPGTAGAAGAGGNPGAGGTAGGGAGASAGQAGFPTAGASGSSAGGIGGTAAAGSGGMGTSGAGGGSAGSGGTGGSGGSAAGAGGGGTGGSGGSGGSNEMFGAAFKSVAQIIQSRCASECHGQQEGLENRNDLRTADLGAFYTRLTTPLMTDHCYGKKLVVPGNVKESLLVVAIKGEENDCVLPRMPINCEGDACLPAADIQTIESWIAAGAPKN